MDYEEFSSLLKKERSENDDSIRQCYLWYSGLEKIDQIVFEIMAKSSSEEIRKIMELVNEGELGFYIDYHELMYSEGPYAAGDICGREIPEDVFAAMYDKGLVDDDRIFDHIKMCHNIYHMHEDCHDEPYVIWFS